MCEYCDYDSTYNKIHVDPLDNRYYLDVQTYEWDNYDDDFVHMQIYINYCPYCGRKLKEE